MHRLMLPSFRPVGGDPRRGDAAGLWDSGMQARGKMVRGSYLILWLRIVKTLELFSRDRGPAGRATGAGTLRTGEGGRGRGLFLS